MTTGACVASRSAIRTTTTADPLRADLLEIYRAAVAAVDPEALVAGRLSRVGDQAHVALPGTVVRAPARRVVVAGAGKAAVAMARAAARVVPEASGAVIAPHGPGPRTVGSIRVLRGDHPVPGASSFRSTRALLDRLAASPDNALVLFLLSGGASSLLAAPAAGLRVADKRTLGRLLLGAGLPIGEMNVVRKHASAVKGGRLATRLHPRRVVTLALSDVPAGGLATIGSGPTVADPSTVARARRALEGSGTWGLLPPRLRAHFSGDDPDAETPKPGDRRLARAQAAIVASNGTACGAARRRARRLGYRPSAGRRLRGDVADAAARLAADLRRVGRGTDCVVAGGETTVRLAGEAGRGGRNQELALHLARSLPGSGWTVLAAGTDGIDGVSPAAGAWVDGGTVRRLGARRIDQALSGHDSYGLLESSGDAFVPGPTGTNVMDIVVAVRRRA